MPVLLPGLRYDYPLPAGASITREHLISLTGGYPAPVVEAPARQVEQVLENAAEQLFGDPLLLDNSQDLPRWQSQAWRVSYSPQGKRVTGWSQCRACAAPSACSLKARLANPCGNGRSLARPAAWRLAAGTAATARSALRAGASGWHPRQLAS